MPRRNRSPRRRQQQAEETRKQIVEDAQKEADGIRAEATASAKLKAQMLWLERREKLLDDVFTAVNERLKEIPGRPDYEASPQETGRRIR